jgi:mRNA interferase MazF
MASIRKGGIYLVNFDPTVGAEIQKIRPAVVVSNDINNAHSPIISIAPITSRVARIFSFEVEIPAGVGGLTERSKVMVNQTRAIDKMRILKQIGTLEESYLRKIDTALKLHYDLT